MAFLAGIHYWFPKMFGRMYSEFYGRIAWVFVFVGFNVLFFPQFILGTKGMPRRYYTYLPEFQTLNIVSTVGSWILGIGFLIMLGYLLYALFKGPKAPANPWGALTLEWQTDSPPITENFREDPVVTRGPYAFGEGHG